MFSAAPKGDTSEKEIQMPKTEEESKKITEYVLAETGCGMQFVKKDDGEKK
jgi:hypothetical protein